MQKNYGFKVGDYARLKSSPTYTWVKIIDILPAGSIVRGQKLDRQTAKCEHVVNKGDTVGFIRYFDLSKLARVEAEIPEPPKERDTAEGE